jgi:hypothetical protein
MYAIFELSAASRMRLLEAFPPSLPVVVCDHVTLFDGADDEEKRRRLAEEFNDGWEAVGLARSTDVVALVVAHHGDTVRSLYDDGVFHCTHSLADGHDAVESNQVIARNGWDPLPQRIALDGKVRLS